MTDFVEIPLTRGYVAVVDRAHAHLAAFKWHARVEKNGLVYAARHVSASEDKNTSVLMHRAIMGDACAGLQVDHIDGNGLNNRASNLRAVTHEINRRNVSGSYSNGTSGLIGVSWHSGNARWRAHIKVDGRKIHLGYFENIDDANAARLAAEAKYWGVEPRRAAEHSRASELRATLSGERT